MPAGSDLTREVLDTLARAWLTSARGFGVWQGAELVAWWPRDSQPEAPEIEVPLDGLGDGWRIGVCGVSDDLSRARLQADAALAVRLTRSSAELDLLTEQLIERQDQLLALYELVRSARSTLDLPVTLQNLSRDTSRLLRAERGFLAFDPGRADPDPSDPALALPGFASDEPRPASTLVAIDGEKIDGHSEEAVAVNSLIPRLRATKRELVLSNTPAGAALGHRYLLAAPVRVRDVVTAVLGAARSDEPFASADVKLARAIAEQAGAQIENALLHEDRVAQVRLQAEMQLAVRVQSDLLPHTWPQLEGLEFFATSKPASLVGGDFYDVVPTFERDFFVCLGDVSGKGFPAALVMSMTHAALRVAVRGSYRAAPDIVLKTTVASLYDDFTRLEMFATAFLARYAHEHRVLHYVNAGHAPVVYRPRGGPAVLLSADVPPLGMLPDAEGVETHILGLRSGDLLVAATDGLNEARAPSGELFGYERLLALIDRTHDEPAPAIVRAVLDAVFAFQAGRSQDDDQTLIVLKGVDG